MTSMGSGGGIALGDPTMALLECGDAPTPSSSGARLATDPACLLRKQSLSVITLLPQEGVLPMYDNSTSRRN